MVCHRSYQHCAEYHQLVQQHRPHIFDGSKHAQQLQRDREDLRAGQEVLRCTEVGEQPRQRCMQGAADHPHGGRHYGHLHHYQVNVYQNMINSHLFLLPLQPNFIHSMAEYSINRIRVVLAEQNKTNRWLAEQMGKSEITISRWVQNKSQPSLEQLLQVAKLLSISPKDLINDVNNTEAKNV